MKCLLCHKKVSRLRAWKTKSEFCCEDHAETYKKQTLERLLRDQEELIHKVSARPLPIPADLSEDDGLDSVLDGATESDGLDRSRLLPAAEPTNKDFLSTDDDLPFTPAASGPGTEGLDSILTGGQAETPDDVLQQTPEDALEALRRIAQHPVAKPLHVDSDEAGASGADEDALLGPLERLAALRNVDTQQLLDEELTSSDPSSEEDRDQLNPGSMFGGSSETVGKQRSLSDSPSALDRIMDADRWGEPSRALPMPGIGERLELDGSLSSDGSLDSQSVGEAVDSVADASVADSEGSQHEADVPAESSIPLWLREFESETSGMDDPIVRELTASESLEPDLDQARFSADETWQEPLDNTDLDILTLGPEEERSEYEDQAGAGPPDADPTDADPAEGGPNDTLEQADWTSELLQGGGSEATRFDAESKTAEPLDQAYPEEDSKLAERAAPETAQPADEMAPADGVEPRDLDIDWAAVSDASPAMASEDQETLDSLLAGLVATAEDDEVSQESELSLASGEAEAAPSAEKVVRFPGPDELTQLKAASSQNLDENELTATGAAPSDADSALDSRPGDRQHRLTPWPELMELDLSAHELPLSHTPEQEQESAEYTAIDSAPRLSPSDFAPISPAGLSAWRAMWAQDAQACEEIEPANDVFGLDTNAAQTETSGGVRLGDGALGAVRCADRIPPSEELIAFRLRPTGTELEGFLGHQEDLHPGGIGKYVSLPLEMPETTFAPRLTQWLELTVAALPLISSEGDEFALNQFELAQVESTTLLGAGTATYSARPVLQPISPAATLTVAEGLFAVEPQPAESFGEALLQQQAEVAVPILELQSPNRVAARTPLKPIPSSGCLETFGGLWVPTPQFLDLPEQTADRMHGDLIRSKVECRLSSLADTRYGLAVNDCHMTPNRLLRCFWPAWAEPIQEPVVDEGRYCSMEPQLAPRMPEAVYHRARRSRTTFPQVERLLTATEGDPWKMSAMTLQPDLNLDNLKDMLAHSDMPLADFGGEVRDWRAEPIGPLLALRGPESLDPCEYA